MTPLFTFSGPGGRSSIDIRSSSPDPAKRYALRVSDSFMIGADGLEDLGKQLVAFAKSQKPRPKTSGKKAGTPNKTEGDADE